MVPIQYMSDLHLERIKYQYDIIQAAPILILAGDIGRFCDYDPYREFLAKQCEPGRFDTVLLVAGNHEFYGSSRSEGLENAERLTREPIMHGKLHFLDRGRFDLADCNVTVLGCTLHSYIAAGYTKLTNDFARIKDWSVAKHNAEHEKDLAWLKLQLSDLKQNNPERQIIIATHYAPVFERVCHPKNENNAVSQCFSSNAFDDVQKLGMLATVDNWIFGHTHWNARIKRRKVMILSNQLCNDHQNLTWWQKKTLYRSFDPEAAVNHG